MKSAQPASAASRAHPPVLSALLSAVAAFLVHVLVWVAPAEAQNPNVRPPANAVTQSTPPPPAQDSAIGETYRVELWEKLRQGYSGKVSIADPNAGVLVQAEGERWRELRRQILQQWGSYALAAMLALLTIFYLVRGRVRIEAGPAGTTMTRFTSIERSAHWLMAVSFIIQGLTGLNSLYGRDVLLPLIGKEAFASLAMTGKTLHAYVAFAFMVGLLLSFLLWVRHNFPNRHDAIWLAKAGGLFSKHSHPPARKFNAGQKILFWMIVVGGVLLSLSGLALLLPFEFSLFARIFAALNVLGFGLPTDLTPLQEMQYAATWHSIIALALVCVIFGHIYIGTIGMEGAFDAMGSGEVDVNWAEEHHSLWVAEEQEKARAAPSSQGTRLHPAE